MHCRPFVKLSEIDAAHIGIYGTVVFTENIKLKAVIGRTIFIGVPSILIMQFFLVRIFHLVHAFIKKKDLAINISCLK
jgi:hypothetical protein